jgi:hypothetical protein
MYQLLMLFAEMLEYLESKLFIIIIVIIHFITALSSQLCTYYFSRCTRFRLMKFDNCISCLVFSSVCVCVAYFIIDRCIVEYTLQEINNLYINLFSQLIKVGFSRVRVNEIVTDAKIIYNYIRRMSFSLTHKTT